MNNETRPTSKTPLIAAGVLTLAVIGGLIAWMFGGSTTDTTEQTTTDTPANTQETGSESTSTENSGTPTRTNTSGVAYKDGMFTDVGQYSSPAGTESVKVTLTIKNDVVTEAAFTGNAVNPTSKMLQQRFNDGYKAQVVGKKLDAISLGVVNGASLTPKGFMDAIAKIKVNARS